MFCCCGCCTLTARFISVTTCILTICAPENRCLVCCTAVFDSTYSIQCTKPESGHAKILLLAMYTHIHMQWQRNRNMIGEAGVRGCLSAPEASACEGQKLEGGGGAKAPPAPRFHRPCPHAMHTQLMFISHKLIKVRTWD